MIKEEDIKEGLRFVLPKLKEDRESATYGNSVHRFVIKRDMYRDDRFFVVTHIDKDAINFCVDTKDQAFCMRCESIGSIFCDADYYGYLGEDDPDATQQNNKIEQVSHPSHYAWLKELCGVEPLDICQHLDFCCGSAIKYILRKGKEEKNLTEKEQRVQDLEKAKFYIETEIKLLKDGKD